MFYDQDQNKPVVNGTNGYVGPMLGQHHQFHYYNLKDEFGEKRYFKIVLQIYNDLDERLAQISWQRLFQGTLQFLDSTHLHDIGLKI